MKKVAKSISIGLLSSALLLAGCTSPTSSVPVMKNVSGYQTAYPTKVKGALHNVGMGWNALEEQTELGKMNLGHDGTLPEVDSIGIQTSWDIIEKEEGVFDWSLIDETIQYWTGLGNQINLRICTDSLSLPEVYYGAPRWLQTKYGVDVQYYDYAGGKNNAIVFDTTNPIYREKFEIFLAKLSEKYLQNPAVNTIDIRGYGMYGEWHSGHSFATMEEREAGLAYIIDKYAEAFAKEGKTLFLSCSYDIQGANEDGTSAIINSRTSYEKYLKNSALDYAMSKEHIGYRRDGMSGYGITDIRYDERALSDVIRSGKHAVNAGEFFTGFDDYMPGGAQASSFSPLEATDELLFKSRCNYATVLGWVNTEVARIVDAGYEEVFERGATKMGYRFCVDEAIFPEGISAGTTFSTKIKLSNSGVGRFSLPDYHFGLMLIDESGKIVDTQLEKTFDLRQLLNGETVNLFLDFDCKSNLKEGEYTLASFIANKDGEPAIRLGQVGNYDQMIYPLGKMKVGAYEMPSETLYERVEKLADLELKPSTQYELTFDYVPSVNVKTDYKMGDSHGFEVQLSDGQETIMVCNWQDVSETLTTKTVTFATPDSGKYRVNILGTGVYQGKIQVSNMKVNSYKGNMEDFAQRRTHGWSVGNDTTYEIFQDGNEYINSSNVIYLESHTLHEKLDTLIYDGSLKNNAAYTIHFDFKGATATSGTYYYVRLVDENNQEVQSIGEWYDRNDMNSSNKTFTFITPEEGKNLKLAIGVKNSGAFYLDNIHLVELAKGNIVRGPEVGSTHNERVYDAKKGLNYVEGFENRVLNDSTFTYGFNRWGHLTRDIREVISGNYSMSSDIDETTFHYQDRNDFYEFCYSNPKYIKLKPNTTYHVEFKYKKMSNIQLVSDPHLAGNGYVFIRSLSNPSAASPTMDFATSLDALEEVYTFQGDFVCPNEEDCYFILSLLGRGNVIIDDISIGEK